MVTHIGFTTTIETISTYNTESKEEETTDLPLKLSKFDDIEIYTILGAIVAKADNIGCVCICLDVDISNDTRKKIFNHAQRLGIDNLAIISFSTAMFLDILYQQNIIPEVGDYIWIQYDTSFNIWIQKEKSAELVTTCELEKMLEVTANPPNILISWSKEGIDQDVVKEVYPNCKTYVFNDYYTSKGALIKARILANDLNITGLNGSNIEPRSFNLMIGKNAVITIKEKTSLPIQEKAEIDYQPGSILKVCYGENIDYLRIPEEKKFLIDFSVNESGIYSVRYLNINKEILQPNENDAKMESVFAINYIDYFWHKVVVAKNVLQSISLTASTEDTSKLRASLQHLIDTIENLDSIASARSFEPLSRYYLPKKIQTYESDIAAIGIDLGTTRSCAYVTRKNGIEPVALDNLGQHMLPSYVTFEKLRDICGEYAVSQMRTNAKATIFDVKRMIGKKYNEITIDKSWPFHVYNDGDRILIGIKNENASMLVPPLFVSGLLLAHIKEKIDEYQGKESNEVVITTPTAFTQLQHIETVVAAIFSGWNLVHLLPEPLAAAFAYFIDRDLPVNSHFLLFDFGGGTLDVCLLKMGNDHIQIENTAGDSFLGGRDLDNILINYCQKKLEEDFGILINTDLKKYKLMDECQKLKHNLSLSYKAQINVSDIHSEKEDIIVITQAEFEAMSANVLSKIESVIEKAIYSFEHCRIEKVLMAGGGSRMPIIEKLLKRRFPNAELCKEQNPEEVVAKGAAYYAYYIAKLSKESSKTDSSKKKKDCTVM